MEIKRRRPDSNEFVLEKISEPMTFEQLYKRVAAEYKYPIIAVRVNNKILPLNSTIDQGCKVEFLDMRNQAANLIYQYSLSMIYLKAVEEVFGRVDTEIQNSLNKGLYTEIDLKRPIVDSEVQAVQHKMEEIVQMNIPFEEEVYNYDEAMEFFDKIGLSEKKRLLMASPKIENVKLYSLDGFKNFFYGYMVPSTGYIERFQLVKYRNGVLLRFPYMGTPLEIPEYMDEEKMYGAFSEAGRWKSLMEISYVSDLNEKIKQNQMREIIQVSEALHEKKIVEIAKTITDRNKRIILIAGPSSSGKTTFARRLCIQLKVNGQKPLYLGTDDYFVNRADTPLDEYGERDYENLGALDIKLFNDDMNKLLSGQLVDLPEYDFMEGKKIFGRRVTSLAEGQPIVIEGIHGLNEALTREISPDAKYKIYISPLTQLAIDNHNRIPTTDARMLRRMVRDFKYRGHSAEDTIINWPKVRKGEDVNIFPYSSCADALFNSSHIYEMAILKKYAEPLLREIGEEMEAYGEARRMLKYLSFFDIFEQEEIIANNSILREFIGGSVFS